jgi:hypothetical protein
MYIDDVVPDCLLEHHVYWRCCARLFTGTPCILTVLCQIVYWNILYIDGVVPDCLLKHPVYWRCCVKIFSDAVNVWLSFLVSYNEDDFNYMALICKFLNRLYCKYGNNISNEYYTNFSLHLRRLVGIRSKNRPRCLRFPLYNVTPDNFLISTAFFPNTFSFTFFCLGITLMLI